MDWGITRWNTEPLKWRGLPDLPMPFSPVQSALKFPAVLGTTSVKSCMTMRPAGAPANADVKENFKVPWLEKTRLSYFCSSCGIYSIIIIAITTMLTTLLCKTFPMSMRRSRIKFHNCTEFSY